MGLEKGSTILVTGATGFIGRRLSAALLERGYELAVFSRDSQRAKKQFPQAKLIADWSPRRGLHPVSMIEQVQAIIHLAGESVAGLWSAAKKRAIRQSRVQGTQDLVTHIAQAKSRPQVLISASAVGYYGDRGDETLTEESAPGQDFLAKVCQEWEAEAARAEAYVVHTEPTTEFSVSAEPIQELNIRVVCVRTGLVLERSGGALKRMLLPFQLGLGGPLGSGKQWMPWIHLDDEIGLILHALENETLSGPINATAPEPVRNSEFTKTLGQVLNRPTVVPAPEFMLRLVLGEFADVLLASQRVLPVRAQASGYEFQYPTLESALRACLRK